ncbi:MAG TPA: class I SAM-dependent methyltransferase [Aliidongia sp.]|uniref:class I SAM-dependent methyltransferase n=1 Tax=Aliidongia sp. TaxID=1914230 RepID=UPI002DDCD1DF|nr:class I SAM-dependent methyltransferase [Aliidongia sp.]HEV2673944.1 class I SAM-dependent methyltransferase [Aliidongia sp.]
MTEPVPYGEYDDAALYDAENGWGPDDDFYRSLAAETGGPVLDLACGTGRLARALAGDGHDVTGLDLAAPMIEHARTLDAAGAVDWHVGDAISFDLGRCFRLIVMTAHAFQHLIGASSQAALFARVARHLAPDGIFAFETRNPGQQDYADGAGFKFWHRFTDPARGPVEVWAASAYDAATEVDHVTLVRRFADGTERRSEAQLQFTAAAILDARLATAGLVCDRRYGDFGRESFGPGSPEIVTLARRG